MGNGTVWKTAYQVLRKLNILLPYDAEITLLGLYPNGLRTSVYIKTCMWIFIAALYIITKIWKWLRCPSVSEWRSKLCYTQIITYYLAQKNELLSHGKTWRSLKRISLSEISQSKKATYYMFPITWHSGKKQKYRYDEKVNGCQRLGEEGE